MGKLERIPEGWVVVNEGPTFRLLNREGEVKAFIVYDIDKDSSGKRALKLVSVASREKGKGYYGLLLAGLESFAKTEGLAYFVGHIKHENVCSLMVHEHYGFVKSGYFFYNSGKEKVVEVRKEVSTSR